MYSACSRTGGSRRSSGQLDNPRPSENRRRGHVGHSRRVNIPNGHGAKTVQTEVGPVRIQVPRDRARSFTPRVVPKHVRRWDWFNEVILSLYAKGLTTGEISAHLADVYDVRRQRRWGIAQVLPVLAGHRHIVCSGVLHR